MKTKIFADKHRLSLSTPPHGSSIGNKILHLFFVLKVASMHNLDPVITTDSNLDLIFDCSGIKHLNLQCPPYLFVEESAYSCNDIRKVAENSREQFFREKTFMESSFAGRPDFSISGHFYHFDLMSSKAECEKFIKIRPELITSVIKRYPSIVNSNVVGVHYRGLDFKRHLSNIFGSIVPDYGYYKRAIEQVERRIHGNIEFHLFSDEPEFLKTLFRSLGKKYITHSRNSFQEDWVAMYLIPNIICSNSSFCWTACLWNKSVVVQANGGVNYYNSALGPIPYGVHIPNAVLISSKSRVFRNFLLEFRKRLYFLKILKK